jgi:hypothetical protein
MVAYKTGFDIRTFARELTADRAIIERLRGEWK